MEQFELAVEGRQWIHLVWIAFLVVGVCAWAIGARRRKLDVFGYDKTRSTEWLAALRRRRWVRALLLASAVVFLTAAAVQPRANPERTTYKTSGRDLVVLLDVSRSMLADDLQPSRLERAKLEIARMARNMKGDRLALVVFAGDAVVACPLTGSYSYFNGVLKNVDATSAPHGGTRIGTAVHRALADVLGMYSYDAPDEKEIEAGETVIADELRGKKEVYADILLITDGEDHDSHPVMAAQSAARHNVGIYAVGIGSEEGTPIPIRGKDGTVAQLRDREGNVVRSRLDSETLREMVNRAPRGQYLPVGTRNFDLLQFFREKIDVESQREIYEEQVAWTEIFQPFLVAGLLAYMVYLLLPERPGKGRQLTVEVS